MSSSVVELPTYIALRSQYDSTILRYIKEEGDLQGFLHFHAKNVRRAEAKFEVHSSKIGHGLVHIRSCYNNKYLVLNETNNWIVAKAEKPEEDHLKRSCTLLRPTSVDGDPKKIRLTNVHLENNLCLWRTSAPYYGCGLANYPDPDASSCDVFTVIDWQSLLTADCKEDCLNAGSATINRWAKFKVFEFILSRKIENIKFRLMDARIYDDLEVSLGL